MTTTYSRPVGVKVSASTGGGVGFDRLRFSAQVPIEARPLAAVSSSAVLTFAATLLFLSDGGCPGLTPAAWRFTVAAALGPGKAGRSTV